MTEIEKCVCGCEARFDGEWVSCYECGREGEVFTFGEPDARAKAIASWNHDQRGLRLLRERGELIQARFRTADENRDLEREEWELDEQILNWFEAKEQDRE